MQVIHTAFIESCWSHNCDAIRRGLEQRENKRDKPLRKARGHHEKGDRNMGGKAARRAVAKSPLENGNLPRARSARRTIGIILLLWCFVAPSISVCRALPNVQALSDGKWPLFSRGPAFDVKIDGRYAYIAVDQSGLAIFDISDPANCVSVGGYEISGPVLG